MLYKIFKYVAIAVGVLGLIFLGRIVFAGEGIENSADVQNSLINPFLIVTYIILALVILCVLIFTLKGLFETDNVKATLISIGAFVVIFIISYISADNQEMTLANGTSISGSGAKWVSSGLIMFYILAVVSILSMIGGWVKSIMNRK